MYLPWLAFFDKLVRAEVFVLLDSVQFERNSFTNRNLVKTANGPVMLTVPVGLRGHLGSTIARTPVADDNWRRKHLKTIEQAYARAPRAAELMPELAELYDGRRIGGQAEGRGLVGHVCAERLAAYGSVGELNEQHLRFWMQTLGIKTPLVRSSDLDLAETEVGSDLILAICRKLDADGYISGPLGRAYIDEARFARAGVDVEFQAFPHPTYQQLHGDFVAGLGIVDFVLNGGMAHQIRYAGLDKLRRSA
jgi:hypothetical protein